MSSSGPAQFANTPYRRSQQISINSQGVAIGTSFNSAHWTCQNFSPAFDSQLPVKERVQFAQTIFATKLEILTAIQQFYQTHGLNLAMDFQPRNVYSRDDYSSIWITKSPYTKVTSWHIISIVNLNNQALTKLPKFIAEVFDKVEFPTLHEAQTALDEALEYWEQQGEEQLWDISSVQPQSLKASDSPNMLAA